MTIDAVYAIVICLGLIVGAFTLTKRHQDKRAAGEEKEYYDNEIVPWPGGTEWNDQHKWDEPAYHGDPLDNEEYSYDQEPPYESHYRAGEQPLDWWRRERMPKVTKIPVALLRNGAPVVEGEVLPIGDPDSGRKVKIINPVPDENGGIMVQENYLTAPSSIGAEVNPEKVVLELNPDEAKAILKFYEENKASTPGSATSNIGDNTRQFAGPVFNDLKSSLGT